MSGRDWYKDALFYELRVRSFFDSDGDGIGDLRGLTQKLDYLQDLGVTALWLLPFYPSPMRDDGYDIADYFDVHSAVGKLDDFREFVDEAHRRDLRVVTELVLNHTSDQHAWFQRARKAPAGSPEREFYVWSDTTERYSGARIIFTDYESSNWSWDPVAKAYFWHRFFSHQPDLNFENPAVRKTMLEVVDFWLEMGVDGLRLDAVPYLFEREGTSSENLPETHAYLRELRAHVDRKFDDRMLLAEANQWPEDAAAYFGSGDECHMAFHFPIMPRLYLSLRMEDSFPILDILEQTPAIPETAQWALFLRNHDELTLEMVTEEERDLMLRAYGRERQMRINLGIRRRLAPLLDHNRRRIELMNALLFSLPGTPVIYYGDEIGMGDNVYLGDRNGVRTPMQWSPDRNGGFSRANPQSLVLPPIVDPEYHFEAINVETQDKNPSSLLWWTKRLIALRKQHSAFGRGTFEPLATNNRAILAFLRRYGESVILVAMNLSRFTQCVDLDLASVRERTPVELFGRARFPAIGKEAYRLSFGPHDFYWFSLEAGPQTIADAAALPPPMLAVRAHWFEVLARGRQRELERALGGHLLRARWFRAKSKVIRQLSVSDMADLGDDRLVFLDVTLGTSEIERYISVFAATHAESPDAIVRLRNASGELYSVVDKSAAPELGDRLVELLYSGSKLPTQHGEIVPRPTAVMSKKEAIVTRVLSGDHTNTCYLVGDAIVVKLLRKLEDGPSVEVEMLRELEPHADGLRLPALYGSLELIRPRQPAVTVASFVEFIPNQGDAWNYVLDEVNRYFDQVLASSSELTPPSDVPILGPSVRSELAVELVGGPLEAAKLLGRRTGELHRALGRSKNADFEPRAFGELARRAVYQGIRARAVRAFDTLERSLPTLTPELATSAHLLLEKRPLSYRRLRALLDVSGAGSLIRVHGDFHLGQVLYTGKDFAIIDFEGEPGRTLEERRRRRSPLVDVAGLLRSYHYAVASVLCGDVPVHGPRELDVPRLAPWARAWTGWVCQAFVQGYLDVVAGSGLIPDDPGSLEVLLDVFLLEKAFYELVYELDNRPHWVGIPLAGLSELLAEE